MFKKKKKTKVHFIGVGGIGMSGIAQVLLNLGYPVSGSDLNSGPNTEMLKNLGAEIFLGHDGDYLKDCDVIVVSSAIKKSNEELKEARKLNIPIIRRAEMLAELMQLKYGIAVAGTHGKTTTTSILGTILQGAGLDPTHIIGGVVSNLGGHAKVGKGDFLLAEADESDGTFLCLNPVLSVITNIDLDHLDYYKDEASLLKAFTKFANKAPFYGKCAINCDDQRIVSLLKKIRKPYVTFGINPLIEGINFLAKNIKQSLAGCEFELLHNGESEGVFHLPVPGHHNVLNCLGAIAIAQELEVNFATIRKCLRNFNGVERRLNCLYNEGESFIYDDYAHHPTEIKATLNTLYQVHGRKPVVVFEPHRYSRTKDVWKEFLHCFNDAERVYISEIYPASETPIEGISHENLIKDINQVHPNLAVSITLKDDFDNLIKESLEKKNILISLGAGAIGKRIRTSLQNML